MNITVRQGAVFVSGILLGAVAAVWFVRAAHSPPSAAASGPQTSIATPLPMPVAQRNPAEVAPSATAAAKVSHERAACPAQPVTASIGGKDGQFVMQTNVDAKTASDIPSFILAGKEAAAAGRPHDAEIAFLMACRVADKLKGQESVESADARYQLGRHYATLARAAGTPMEASRAELLRRAQVSYADSVETYRARYGDANEKTRYAAEGLAGVQAPSVDQQQVVRPLAARPVEPVRSVAAARVPALAAAPAPEGVAVAVPAARTRQAPRKVVETVTAAPQLRQATGDASVPSPSFDCARAQSRPEQIICSDAQLAQLDRELGRLHARARTASSDPAAFRRQNDQEWRDRESTCRDRECLLRWYAHRRDQLLNDIEDARDQRQPILYR